MDKHVDVVVVGAGPVGLLLAIELTLGGADVMVLERLAAPNLGIKAPSVGPLGAEALERRGMGAALVEAEDRTSAAMGPAGVEMRARMFRSREHFALLPIRSDAEPERRMRWIDQQALEAILGERAAALDTSPDRRAAGLAASFTRVRYLPAEAGPSMLIRPDGCVAWAGDVGEVEGFVDALERWFAPAAPGPGGLEERSCSARPSSSAPSGSEQRT